jgi:hypothetical protein
MNMPPPVGSKPFREHTKAKLRAAKYVAEQTIKDAAQEIYEFKTEDGEDIVETAVSCVEHGKEGDFPGCSDAKP